ncbi:MAG: hypothetical protein AAF720_06885 [Pseudomonadota bacterium]
MVRFSEAVEQIDAVWDMILDRQDWKDRLDVSERGVFRSFWSIAYTVPLAATLYYLGWHIQEKLRSVSEGALPDSSVQGVSFNSYLSIQALSFLGAWIAGIVLFAGLAHSLKCSQNAGLAFVSYNWAQVPLTFFQVLILAFIFISPSFSGALFLILSVYAISTFMYWGIIRRAFNRDTGVSIAIIAMLVLVEIAITSVAGAIVSVAETLFT